MKKITAILLIFTLAAILTIPVFAVAGTVGKFTPTLDGDKDEAYDRSVKVNLYTDQDIGAGEFFHSEGDAPDSNAADATAWFLYDDEFLYIFVEVKDSDIFDIGKELYDSRENNYQSDSVELWFTFGDDPPFIKFSTVAFGHGIFGNLGQEVMVDETLRALGYDAKVKMGTDGWTAEFKAPIKEYGLKEGSVFYFTLQLNNMDKNEALIVSGRQLQGGGTDDASVLTLGAPIVIAVPEPEPQPAPEPQPEPASPAPEPAAPAPAAPPTGDMSVLFILPGLLAAGASFLKFGKKK